MAAKKEKTEAVNKMPAMLAPLIDNTVEVDHLFAFIKLKKK